MAVQRKCRLPIGDVPELNGRSAAAGGEEVAIGTEGHAAQVGSIGLNLADFCAVRGVPENDDATRARGCQEVAVGAEGHAPNLAAVAFQCQQGRLAKPRQVIPLETAEVGFPFSRRLIASEQLQHARILVILPGAMRKTHIRPVLIPLGKDTLLLCERMLFFGMSALFFGDRPLLVGLVALSPGVFTWRSASPRSRVAITD